jgi:hypothetical protein
MITQTTVPQSQSWVLGERIERRRNTRGGTRDEGERRGVGGRNPGGGFRNIESSSWCGIKKTRKKDEGDRRVDGNGRAQR